MLLMSFFFFFSIYKFRYIYKSICSNFVSIIKTFVWFIKCAIVCVIFARWVFVLVEESSFYYFCPKKNFFFLVWVLILLTLCDVSCTILKLYNHTGLGDDKGKDRKQISFCCFTMFLFCSLCYVFLFCFLFSV